MKRARISTAFLVACGGILLTRATFSFAPPTPPVMASALQADTPLESNLWALTDRIGGRITGTPAFDRAREWAIAAFRQAGADTVTAEHFQLPQSWAEGKTQAEIVSPVRFPVRAQSLAWTPALSSLTARVVDVNEGSPSDFEQAGDIAGAIVLVHSNVMAHFDVLMQEYFRSPAIIQAAVKGRATAVAFTSTRPHNLLYRHINVFTGRIDRLPQVLLAREDSLRMQRILAHGEPVRMALSVPNQIGPPVDSQNVVAEWKGSGSSKQVVIVGAHLDSWELGTGALDNGCNAALIIDALRAIHTVGRPSRTIRFILFSGEEQGMLGSLAYVRAHRSELDDIVAAIIIDAGSGAITGFNTGGRRDIDAVLETALGPVAPWKATGITNDAGGGTDNFDFQLEGVPTLVPNQEPANYLASYHASSDTFDKVDLKQLKINEAIVAQAAMRIANLPTRLGVRQDRAQVEELLHEVHLDEELKALGLWQSWVDGSRGRKSGLATGKIEH